MLLIEKLKNNELILTPSEDIVDEDTSSNSNASHLEQYTTVLKQNAKETSLIIERRAYKKPDELVDNRKSEVKEESVKSKITESELNESAVQESIEKEENEVKNKLNTAVCKNEESNEKSNDTKDERTTQTTENDNSKVLNYTVEEPIMLVKGEGSGAECEAQPIFSDVIEEPILYVYGPGNGIGNQMGNIKKCEESTTEETTPKDLRQTEKSDLPLKKKLNRSYNYDAHQGTSPNESKESIRIVNKVENESTIKKEHHAEYHKSSEHKETDLDMTSNASNDVQENQLLSENKKKTILSEINNTKTEEKNIPYDSAEETSNSSYEELLPKEENSKTCDASSLKTEHDNDKQKPTSRTRHKNTQNTETSTNSEKLKNDKLSLTIESQPSVPQKTRKGRRSKSGIGESHL